MVARFLQSKALGQSPFPAARGFLFAVPRTARTSTTSRELRLGQYQRRTRPSSGKLSTMPTLWLKRILWRKFPTFVWSKRANLWKSGIWTSGVTWLRSWSWFDEKRRLHDVNNSIRSCVLRDRVKMLLCIYYSFLYTGVG